MNQPEQHYTGFQTRDDPRKGLYPGLHQFKAFCSCGWIGQWMDRKSDAEEDANEHVRLT